MHRKIGITQDLADIFFIQALREGYCNYLGKDSQNSRNKFADFMFRSNKWNNMSYQEGFDMLCHMIILHDTISFPILNNSFELTGRIKKIADIPRNFPLNFYSENQLEPEELSDEDAMKMKPMIMNAINNINFLDYFAEYARERAGSIEQLFSKIYDMMYNHKKTVSYSEINTDAAIGYGNIYSDIPLDYKSPELCALYAYRIIILLVKEMMIYFEINKSHEYDYYSRAFNNYNTAINNNDAYIIVKNQISYIIKYQPAFQSLSEVLEFKNKKKNAINDLKNEINSLEQILKEGGREAAIQKAINDVRLANESLIKGNAKKEITQIATYISVPISLIELLNFGTSFSMIISLVGTIGQLTSDLDSKQSDWLFVAR